MTLVVLVGSGDYCITFEIVMMCGNGSRVVVMVLVLLQWWCG